MISDPRGLCLHMENKSHVQYHNTTVEVCEWISNFIPHLMNEIAYAVI